MDYYEQCAYDQSDLNACEDEWEGMRREVLLRLAEPRSWTDVDDDYY